MQQKHGTGLRMMHWCSIRGWSWSRHILVA